MTGSVMKNLRTFTSLCCQQAIPHVILVTPMWGEIKEEATGVRQEEEPKTVFWNIMLSDGCRTERYDHTCESACCIIGSLLDSYHSPALLPSETVGYELPLSETTVAKQLVTGHLVAVNCSEDKASSLIGPFQQSRPEPVSWVHPHTHYYRNQGIDRVS